MVSKYDMFSWNPTTSLDIKTEIHVLDIIEGIDSRRS